MSARADGKRGEGKRTDGKGSVALLHVLFSDPWRKLAAIFLALLLWSYLDTQITNRETLELALETAALTSEGGSRDTLRVTIDQDQYFVAGFYDRLGQQPIQSVLLELRGPKHLFAEFEQNPGFRVSPSFVDNSGPTTTIEFTVDDVRAIAPKCDELVHAMSPSFVRIDLVKNTHREVPLNPAVLLIDAPPEVESRLLLDSVEFSTPAVTLVGPSNQIEDSHRLPRLFRAEVDPRPSSDNKVQGTLQLVDDERISQLRMANGEAITVTVPLKVAFQTYRVTVPYILDTESLPPEFRDQFVASESSADIEIEVSHRLELLIAGMLEDERQRWMRRFARLWVRIDESALTSTLDEDSYTPEFILVGSRNFELGLDYRVKDFKPLRVKRIR